MPEPTATPGARGHFWHRLSRGRCAYPRGSLQGRETAIGSAISLTTNGRPEGETFRRLTVRNPLFHDEIRGLPKQPDDHGAETGGGGSRPLAEHRLYG